MYIGFSIDQITLNLFRNKKNSFDEYIISPVDIRGELWSYIKFVIFKTKKIKFDYDELLFLFSETLAENPDYFKLMKIYVLSEIKKKNLTDKEKVSKYRLCFITLAKILKFMIRFENTGKKIKSKLVKIQFE